jgi:uncharacterized protein YcbK (DUF882 family)
VLDAVAVAWAVLDRPAPAGPPLADARSLPPGVTANEGVRLTPRMLAFLRRLRALTPGDIPIHVNSGYRDARAQAAAMLRKLELGDDLVALYGRKVLSVLRQPPTLEAWTAEIERLARAGVEMSDHMDADALDLRTRGLSSSQLQRLVAAVRRAGARPLLETTPPHLHLDTLGAAGEPVLRIVGIREALAGGNVAARAW